MECLRCRKVMVLSHECTKPRTHKIIQQTFICTNGGRSATRDNLGIISWFDAEGKLIHASHDM